MANKAQAKVAVEVPVANESQMVAEPFRADIMEQEQMDGKRVPVGWTGVLPGSYAPGWFLREVIVAPARAAMVGLRFAEQVRIECGPAAYLSVSKAVPGMQVGLSSALDGNEVFVSVVPLDKACPRCGKEEPRLVGGTACLFVVECRNCGASYRYAG